MSSAVSGVSGIGTETPPSLRSGVSVVSDWPPNRPP
jgi:hypothetical protein